MQVNPPPPAARVKLILTEQEQTKLSSRGYAIQGEAVLGTGGFGADVFRATLNGRPIVVKQQQSVWRSSRDHLQMIAANVYADMSRIRHPHILVFYDVFLRAQSELIFMELCEGGDLQHHLDDLKEPKWLSEPQAIRYFLQFGDALRYLHKLDIVHRAVQPDNIYMGRWKQVCKLGYFGITTTIKNDPNKGETDQQIQSDGILGYQPPEDYRNDIRLPPYPHSQLAGDVWRVGFTLYVMLNGGGGAHHPNGGREMEDILMNPYYVQYSNVTLSKGARRMIASLLMPNPQMRPTMEMVLTEPWLIKGCSHEA